MNTMYSERNDKKQPTNMKRFLVKISMFILCLTGFFVHSYFKIRLFYDQEPITEYLSNEKNSNDDDELIKLPSISVCFSGSLFRRPIDTLNSHRRSSLYYHSKQRLPPNVALLDDLDTHTNFDDDFTLRRRQSRKFNNVSKHSSRSANQMISVDQAFGLVSKPRFSLKCDLIKATKQRKLTRFTDNPLSCEQIAQVIESINYEADKKCFTFFSQLQQTQDIEEDDFLVYRSDLNGGDLVQIRIFFEEELLSSKLNQDKVHVLIHSNLEMPNLQMKTYSLHSSHNYVIYFNQLAYRRMSTNQSPCRLYKNEIKKDYFSISNLKHVKNALIDYQVMIKNHLYKLLFSSNEQQSNATKVDEQEKNSDNNSETETKKDIESRSEADCVDKCHVETNRKYCICLPPGVNVRRELLSANDLLCDSLRCIQEDLPSANVGTSSSTNKNNLVKPDQQATNSDQLERLYSLSNNKFISKRQEKFKKCLEKNNCISSCEEERYDFDVNENADLNLIIQNLMGILPNKTRHSKSLSNSTGKRFIRNYYPNGYYFDPNYQQKQLTSSSHNKIDNKRFSFKHNQQLPSSYASKTVTVVQGKSTFDDLSKDFAKNNGTKTLNTSIVVQDSKTNQTSYTTSSTSKKQNADQQPSSQSNSQTNAFTDTIQVKTTAPTKFETLSPLTTSSGDEINSIDPDNIDDNLDKEDDLNNQDNRDFTQPSLSKFTIYGRKSFKTFSVSTQASTTKSENGSNKNSDSVDDEITDNLPADENIEERNLHNSGKLYQSLISFRNNHNRNRILKQRLSYSFVDLVFDLSLVAVVWLGFSIYLVADYVIYLVVLLFWYSVRLLFCLDWWFKKTRKRRVVDSASSTAQLVNRPSRSSKGSASSEESEGRTYVKSIP